MSSKRPRVPAAIARAVRIEAGDACAIPTCKQTPIEICHIVDWAIVKEHEFENLIALCPTCHTRQTLGWIDRASLLAYKANLAGRDAALGYLQSKSPYAATALLGSSGNAQLELQGPADFAWPRVCLRQARCTVTEPAGKTASAETRMKASPMLSGYDYSIALLRWPDDFRPRDLTAGPGRYRVQWEVADVFARPWDQPWSRAAIDDFVL